MKIRMTFGAKRESSVRFDTSKIPSDNARDFADDVLKVVADAAKGIKSAINDYEAKASATGSKRDDDESATADQSSSADETATTAQAPTEPKTAADTSNLGPCAQALSALDLGEREVSWVAVAGRNLGVVSILETDDQTALWRTVRDALQPAGCYPVLVSRDDLDELLEEGPDFDHMDLVSPQRLSQLRAEQFARNASPTQEPVIGSFEHTATVNRFGRGPSADEIAASTFESDPQVDEFFWRWERTNFGDESVIAAGQPDRDQWFEMEADETALLVLPVPDGAAAVNVLGFWPVFDRQDWVAPLGNDVTEWQDKYGAELVANYGTILQFVVANPPTDLDTAYQLSAELDTVGNATLSPVGITRRHYAADLIGRTRWHLHDRP